MWTTVERWKGMGVVKFVMTYGYDLEFRRRWGIHSESLQIKKSFEHISASSHAAEEDSLLQESEKSAPRLPCSLVESQNYSLMFQTHSKNMPSMEKIGCIGTTFVV